MIEELETKRMYDNYKRNMMFFGKPVSPYKVWLKDVFNTKVSML